MAQITLVFLLSPNSTEDALRQIEEPSCLNHKNLAIMYLANSGDKSHAELMRTLLTNENEEQDTRMIALLALYRMDHRDSSSFIQGRLAGSLSDEERILSLGILANWGNREAMACIASALDDKDLSDEATHFMGLLTQLDQERIASRWAESNPNFN